MVQTLDRLGQYSEAQAAVAARARVSQQVAANFAPEARYGVAPRRRWASWAVRRKSWARPSPPLATA
eukprot:1841636-Alexandrium_andersonii.AAC.1